MSTAHDRYDAQAVEAKWQAEWVRRSTNTFTTAELRDADEPFFNLMMFPYPSAEGLHIGNIYAFTGADVHGRYWRLRGKTVFEPIGFDAFGIHSENYALKVGINPNDLIPRNVANFTRQLKRIGGMFDWNHSVDTTDPAYYKWTQWIFVKLFQGGLAERRDGAVNWCPSCKTVLANEQVIAGLCERCDTPVEQRRLPQWYLQDQRLCGTVARQHRRARLVRRHAKGADELDRPQRRRRGRLSRSTGQSDARVRVFTTRPDTLFGATYMVLAPEHPLVDAVTTQARRAVVSSYRDEVAKRDLVDRKKADKDKTGVFTGGYCINPVNGARVPIWIADYVLMDYGTGAIMAVPGHDERDFEFAQRFALPIVRVIAGAGRIARHTARRKRMPATERWSNSGQLRWPGRRSGRSAPSSSRWHRRVQLKRRSTIGCTTGVCHGSAIGVRRSRSSTATSVAPCRCPNPICRSCCRASRISNPTTPA